MPVLSYRQFAPETADTDCNNCKEIPERTIADTHPDITFKNKKNQHEDQTKNI